jgi:hypothetical protein
MGHEDAFPRPRLSARCRFGKATFGGTHGNEKDAPIPAIRQTAMEPRGPTLKRHFWLRQRDMPTAGSRQLVEQLLRLFQIGRVKALG